MVVFVRLKKPANCKAGADVIVVGNSIEKSPHLIEDIAQSIHQYNNKKKQKCSLKLAPLNASYEEPIIKFVQKTTFSPFYKGGNQRNEYPNVWRLQPHYASYQSEMKATFLNNDKVVFTLKMANSDLQEKPPSKV